MFKATNKNTRTTSLRRSGVLLLTLNKYKLVGVRISSKEIIGATKLILCKDSQRTDNRFAPTLF